MGMLLSKGCILSDELKKVVADGDCLGDCLGYDYWFWSGECVGKGSDC